MARSNFVSDNISPKYPVKPNVNLAIDVRNFVHNSKSDGTGNIVISTMAFIPKFKSSNWPQAALNGLNFGGFWCDVYENSQPDASSISKGNTDANTPGVIASTSKPGVVPWTGISWINARIASNNRIIQDRPCHLMTPFERASLLALRMANGHWDQLRGNNDSGKDIRETTSWENYGILDPIDSTGGTLTGSGPSSWWHNGLPGRGIHNLAGNIWEWENCRLEAGHFRPKAYLAGATVSGALYIDYDDNGNGNGANVSQLISGTYTITDGTNGNENVTVGSVIITGQFTGRLILSSATTLDHIDNAQIQLSAAIDLCYNEAEAWTTIGKLLEVATAKYMALPDKTDTTTYYNKYLDSWYKYDNTDSRVLIRSGDWSNGLQDRSGLSIDVRNVPLATGPKIGFRSALSIGNS